MPTFEVQIELPIISLSFTFPFAACSSPVRNREINCCSFVNGIIILQVADVWKDSYLFQLLIFIQNDCISSEYIQFTIICFHRRFATGSEAEKTKNDHVSQKMRKTKNSVYL